MEILKIIIESQNEYISIASAFKEKIIIQRDSVRYSFIPVFDKNSTKKWSYKSNNKNFVLKYDFLCELIEGLPEAKKEKNKNLLSLQLIDKEKHVKIINIEKSNETIQLIISLIKELIPPVEGMPICLLN